MGCAEHLITKSEPISSVLVLQRLHILHFCLEPRPATHQPLRQRCIFPVWLRACCSPLELWAFWSCLSVLHPPLPLYIRRYPFQSTVISLEIPAWLSPWV